MKKLFSVLIGVLILFGISHSPGNAQEKKPIYLGASINYSPVFEAAAIKANATFGVFPRVSFAPNVVYYINNPAGPGNIETLIGLNLNGHYNLTNGSKFNAYGVGGLHASLNTYDNSNSSGTDYAINAGLGIEYVIDQVLLFSEAKYMIQSWNEIVIGFGIQYRIN